MVHELVNIYTKLQEGVTVQYVFWWASGAPNLRAAPGFPYSSYAAVSSNFRTMPVSYKSKNLLVTSVRKTLYPSTLNTNLLWE